MKVENTNINEIDRISIETKEVGRKIEALLLLSNVATNWYDALLFYFKMKPSFTLRLKNGKQIRISEPNDYLNPNLDKLRFQLLQQRNPKTEIHIHKNYISLRFNGKLVRFYYKTEKEMTNPKPFLSQLRDRLLDALLFIIPVALILFGAVMATSLATASPPSKTVQALCPLTLAQVANLCLSYGFPNVDASNNTVTCYDTAPSGNPFLQPDGPEPSGFILYNYTSPSCREGGWQNM